MSEWIKKKIKKGNEKSSNWITKKEKPTQWIKRKEKSHGGGIGVQTHGVKLARALNTGTPDHTKYLNEHGYLKGGVPVKNG